MTNPYLLNTIPSDNTPQIKPISYSDQAGRTKKFERDAFGRVVKELFPDETSVEYEYNKLGQLDTVLDQNKHKIKFNWSKFGLEKKTSAAKQLTDYVYDKYGMLDKIDSKFKGKTDRSIKYEYDKLDRLVKVTYADNEIETFTYDSWGKLIASTRGNKRASFKYDYFGRMIEKNEGAIISTYAYNPWGQRTTRVTKQNGLTLSESKTYDEFGRLTEIKSNEKIVKYSYNKDNQLIMQLIDGIPVEFTYTKYGQLESKMLGGKIRPISSLKYVYAKDGMIAGRVVNDKVQMYAYDKKGQLLSVADMEGNIAEAYKYDPAGNILNKNIAGKITTFTYDKANQLVTSAVDNKVTNYAYDAAGRLIKEGDKTYSYGYLDKILEVQENGEPIVAFDYHVGGQIAQATHGDKSENFLWDGLALIHRGENSYVNEPYVTGGNPILSSKDGVMFNDMLGTTLGVKNEKGFNAVSMTAFGETEDKSAMFTGKPYIGELGYAFLFRNYRAEQSKWQTSDPLGYPDGWNNLAYCNNGVTDCIDWLGGKTIVVLSQGVGATIYEKASNYWLDYGIKNNINVVVLTYTDNDSMSSINQKLKNYCSNYNTSISELHIADHGDSGVQKLGNNSLTKDNMNELFGGVDFSSNAEVVFEGCNIGKDSALGREFGKAASKATGGSIVEIATDVVEYGIVGGEYVRIYPNSSIYQVTE